MISWKTRFILFTKFLLYFFTLILIDVILIAFFSGGINSQIKYSLSFVMLLEGGIGLIVGGAVVLYSPSFSKMNEVFFHHKPWSYRRQKEIEKQMEPLIVIGLILVIAALLLSAI
ncbi:hypothetical protein ACFLRN_09845 [Thermoproteota archaeon]